MNFQNGRKFLTLLTFGCHSYHIILVAFELREMWHCAVDANMPLTHFFIHALNYWVLLLIWSYDFFRNKISNRLYWKLV